MTELEKIYGIFCIAVTIMITSFIIFAQKDYPKIDLPEGYKAMDYNTPIKGYYSKDENKVYIQFDHTKKIKP